MNKSNWKGFERKVAKDFGTRRTPLSGSNSGHGTCSDTLSEFLYIECKKRKRMAVVRLFDFIKPLAEDEGKYPVLALTETGRRGGYLVVCDIKDLLAIANQIERARRE